MNALRLKFSFAKFRGFELLQTGKAGLSATICFFGVLFKLLGDSDFFSMRQSSDKLRAFTLFELSIVILIVAILIAGVVAASVVVGKSRVANAQALTKFSPVNDVDGLVLWLETTMDKSFIDGEAQDGYNLTQWNDLNPNAETKYYLVRTAATLSSLQDIYYSKSDGINYLPSIYFPLESTTEPAFALSTEPATAPNFPQRILTQNNAFTFFIVEKTVSEIADGNGEVFYNGDIAINGWGYLRGAQSKSLKFGGVLDDGNAVMQEKTPHIVTATFSGGSNGQLNVFDNGIAETLDSPTATVVTPTVNEGFFLGSTPGGNPWHGYLSELIIFDHVLKITDRKVIEQYLGKKYNITVH